LLFRVKCPQKQDADEELFKRCCLLQVFQCGNDSSGMFVRLQAADNRGDLSFRADDERGPVNTHVFPAIHALFLEHAIFDTDGLLHIRQKRIGEIVFFLELLLGRRLIGGDAEHNSASPLDFLECVAEPARFNGSTGRVGLGVKEQDHVLSAIVFQCYCFTLFISKRELRGFIINFHGFPVFITLMNLYSRRKFLASAAVVLVCAAALAGATAQRRKAHKLRATAILEITTDSAGIVSTRVFPVTVLDEGRFNDAGIYKSSPRPMALENGIVYEGQTSGMPAGYATILSGTNNHGWTALGKWQPVDLTPKPPAPPPVVAGDDRPIIRHGDSTTAAAPTGSPTPSSTGTAAADSSPAAPSEDADRPMLKRRDPQKQEPPEPPQSKPTPVEGAVPATKPRVFTPGTKVLVAVSDTESTEPRSYEFKWKAGEEEQMEAKMRKLALAQLPRENAQLSPSSLKNVVMRSFDLDLSNDAVIVFSAEIPGSYLAPGGKATPGKFISRYVTVIARVDFDGLPQRLSASVTDSSRLDVAPRLELIDAVDVDGDGLAELLFREYSFDEKSFIIYGVGRSTVTKVFEGASTPLQPKP
jgi:hypothetical protein